MRIKYNLIKFEIIKLFKNKIKTLLRHFIELNNLIN